MTTIHGRPTAAELVSAVAEFLESDVRGATDGQVNFHARVAGNVLRIVERELAERGLSERPSIGADPTTPVDEAALAAAIRDGEFDGRDGEVMTALRTLVSDRLAVAHPGYAEASVADRLFSAMEAGDVDAVAAMWSDDVIVWRTGDKRPSEKARAMRVIDWFVSATADRHYDVLDRRLFDGGFVQQHVLHGTTRDRTLYSLRVGIIIQIGADGLITSIDEYFDPADLAPLLNGDEPLARRPNNQGDEMTTVTDLLNSPTAVGIWTLDHNRSSFSFKNNTMWGLMNVKGRFTEFSGDGRVDAGGTVSGRLDIKAASLITGIKQRDNHLRSADFFDAEHYPDITIAVSGVDPTDGDELNVRADLSIRGNTVALPMRAEAEVLDDGAVRLTATTTVEREQLGVSGNIAGMVGKTTTLSADAVFHRAGG